MAGRLLVAVGTRKGLFTLEGASAAKKMEVRGPFFPGMGVSAVVIDRRSKAPKVVAAPSSPWFGTTIQVSKDLGKKFKATKSAPAFDAEDGRKLGNIWSLATGMGRSDYYCGLEPAALFHSEDGGENWAKTPGLTDHEHARQWQPGGGGLCLHTILSHGGVLHLGISTGGHYASRDGAKTFAAENTGVGAPFAPNPYPEFGQCVHKIAAHPDRPDRLYMQNHGGDPKDQTMGVLRSDDGGRSWKSIAKGLPSDFGFPVAVHPHDPETVYVVPLEGYTRTCPGAKPAIWRSENGGDKWRRLANGLPKKEAWFTVLRDSLDLDEGPRPSVWFGTTTGQLWRGRDGGESFDLVAGALPPILCVKAAYV